MAQSVSNSRPDAYVSFNFRVKWDGRTVAGVQKISGLAKHTIDVARHRDGGAASVLRAPPAATDFGAVLLERGVSYDVEFLQWASIYGSEVSPGTSLHDARKEMIIEVYDAAGQLVIAYKIHRCWVSECETLSDTDQNSDAAAIVRLKVENEGWERDGDLNGPATPSFTEVSA